MNQAGFAPLTEEPRRWDVLASFMLQQGYSTFIEIGAKEGRTTAHILKTVPNSEVVAVDPWMAQEKSADPTKETYKDWDFSLIEAKFWENVGEHKDRCDMLRMTSEAAALVLSDRMGDAPYDLVFIDALHDYEHVKQDAKLWWPLVRIGGILAFHDFNHKWPGVERAIAESFNLMHVGVAPDSVAFIIKASEDQFRG